MEHTASMVVLIIRIFLKSASCFTVKEAKPVLMSTTTVGSIQIPYFDIQRILTELEHSQNAYDHERRIVPCKYSNSARKEKLHQNSNESLLIKMRHQNSDT